MSEEQSYQHAGQASQSPPALPDINAETYPFEMVQHLLDQAAYFNLYSIPEKDGAIRANGNSIGFRVCERLHRFAVSMQSTKGVGLRASNAVGEQLGRCNSRWLLCPDDFAAVPGVEPPATTLDSGRQQRFVMLDTICELGNGHDGFRGFGTGRTFPTTTGLMAAAVGNVMEGRGRLSGLEGTYVYCGSLTEDESFRGSLLLRVMDPRGVLSSGVDLPSFESQHAVEPGITYFILRGQKKDRRAKTSYSFGPDGQVNGLNVSQQIRVITVDATARGRGGLRSVRQVGPVIGTMGANIAFNLFNPGAPGTDLAPIPFQSLNKYTLYDPEGDMAGSFVADGGEGRTFNMQLAGAPGQRALRFGGFGPLMNGTGAFRDIEGLMTDNSVVGVAPHAIVTFYVLRINDPDGRYRIKVD